MFGVITLLTIPLGVAEYVGEEVSRGVGGVPGGIGLSDHLRP